MCVSSCVRVCMRARVCVYVQLCGSVSGWIGEMVFVCVWGTISAKPAALIIRGKTVQHEDELELRHRCAGGWPGGCECVHAGVSVRDA